MQTMSDSDSPATTEMETGENTYPELAAVSTSSMMEDPVLEPDTPI